MKLLNVAVKYHTFTKANWAWSSIAQDKQASSMFSNMDELESIFAQRGAIAPPLWASPLVAFLTVDT